VEHWDVVPDIVAIAKSLGGGVMPVSSFASTEEIWQVMMDPNPFIHTTTTGGGALACSAAIASINVALRDNFPKLAQEKGDYFFKTLREFEKKYESIYDFISGRGLLIGQHFKDAEVGYKVAAGLFRRGVLVAGTLTSAHTIRIEPPIVITYEQIDEVLNRLEDTLKEVTK